MLSKLMKYEMKSIGRILVPLYLAVLVAAALCGLAVSSTGYGFIDNILKVVITILYILVGASAFIITIILIVQRFYKNLLGDEGYLTLTLPVKIRTHIFNKLFTSTIWIIIGSFVGLLSIFITVSLSSAFVPFHFPSFSLVADNMGGSLHLIFVIIEFAVLTVLSIMLAILRIYASISIAHRFNSFRLLWSFGFFIGFMTLETFIIQIFSNFSLYDFFDLSGITNFETIQLFMLIGFIPLAILSAIYWYVTILTFNKKLNLQ